MALQAAAATAGVAVNSTSRAHTAQVLEGGGGGRAPGRSARLVAEAIAAREPYLTFWKLPAWKPFWQDPLGAALLRSTGLMRT
jgi:hypothetical protein